MPGDSVIQGRQPVEYVEESSFGSDESDGTYNWIGAVTSFSVTPGVESTRVQYLPADDATDKLQTHQNVKVSEAYSVDITYHPQDFTFFQYITGSDGGLADSLTNIQFGEQDEDNSEYRRIKGAVGEELSITISEDEVAEVEASFIAADVNDWAGSDYVGTGSHASEDTSEPYTYDDLGTVNLGGSALDGSVSSLTLTISNDLTVVKDPDASPASHIAAIVPTSREITAELDLTYNNMNMAQTVRNYTKQDLTFNFPSSTSWTVSDTAYPEFPYEFTPEDLVGDTVTSDPATNLTWSAGS